MNFFTPGSYRLLGERARESQEPCSAGVHFGPVAIGKSPRSLGEFEYKGFDGKRAFLAF